MWAVHMGAEKQLYDTEYEKAIRSKDALSIHPEDWINCTEAELKVGDIIFAEYSPDSQKHMYTHYPEYGRVEEIAIEEYYSATKDKPQNEVSVKILNHNGNLVKINKDHLIKSGFKFIIFIR